MELSSKQIVKLSILIHEGKAGRFRATDRSVYGFLDWEWEGSVEGVSFTFRFRSFHDSNFFNYVEFTPLKYCRYIPQMAQELETELKLLLEPS